MEEKHILIVDDEPPMRMLVRNMLTPAGYRVSEAENALALHKLLSDDLPDLIILDIHMPGISGLTIGSVLKRDRTFKVPIIVLTGLTDPSKKQAALDAGADAFLTKPVDRNVLLAKIAELLAPKQS